MNGLLIKTLLMVSILSFSKFAIAQGISVGELPDHWRTCASDKECEVVKDFSGCLIRAVNKKSKTKFNMQFLKKPGPKEEIIKCKVIPADTHLEAICEKSFC